MKPDDWVLKKSNKLRTKRPFKTKRDGRKRARLVVQGFAQVPWVDFTEWHLPVANNVTIRIMLVLAIVFECQFEQIDFETAFLYRKLKESILLKSQKV